MQTTAVYSCVRTLAETIASLPLHTFKHTESGNEKAIEHSGDAHLLQNRFKIGFRVKILLTGHLKL